MLTAQPEVFALPLGRDVVPNVLFLYQPIPYFSFFLRSLSARPVGTRALPEGSVNRCLQTAI